MLLLVAMVENVVPWEDGKSDTKASVTKSPEPNDDITAEFH